MVYDAGRDRTVLFGGLTGSGGSVPSDLSDETWEWNGTRWSMKFPANAPSGRLCPAMAHDAGRGVSVLFGGIVYGNQVIGETWEWNGTNWSQRSPAHTPSPRFSPAMAYDANRGVAVLFGGTGTPGQPDNAETWEWNGTDWTQQFPATGPSARYLHAMAYDAMRHVTVLFGGWDGWYCSDTWEFDGNTWTQCAASGPWGGWNPAMAYDSAHHVTVCFGGYYQGAMLGTTWEWDGTTWVQKFPANAPSPRNGAAMAFHASKGITVLFGGQGVGAGPAPAFHCDTWMWNGTTWRSRSLSVVPILPLPFTPAHIAE